MLHYAGEYECNDGITRKVYSLTVGKINAELTANIKEDGGCLVMKIGRFGYKQTEIYAPNLDQTVKAASSKCVQWLNGLILQSKSAVDELSVGLYTEE